MEEIIKNSMEEKIPVFIRYPKGYLPDDIEKERGKKKRKITILGAGSMAEISHSVCDILNAENISTMSVAIDRIKPVDDKIEKYIESDIIITIEENTLIGGFGSSISEYLTDKNIKKTLLRFGLPDKFIEQGEREKLLEKYGLSPEKIVEKIKEFLNDK